MRELQENHAAVEKKETTVYSNKAVKYRSNQAPTRDSYKLNGSVKEPNIWDLDIFLIFSTHDSMVFYFRCSAYWWKGSVRI